MMSFKCRINRVLFDVASKQRTNETELLDTPVNTQLHAWYLDRRLVKTNVGGGSPCYPCADVVCDHHVLVGPCSLGVIPVSGALGHGMQTLTCVDGCENDGHDHGPGRHDACDVFAPFPSLCLCHQHDPASDPSPGSDFFVSCLRGDLGPLALSLRASHRYYHHLPFYPVPIRTQYLSPSPPYPLFPQP